MKLNTGFRLFIMGLFVLLGIISDNIIAGCVLAVMLAMVPGWKYIPGYLRTGAAEDVEKELLDKISKQTIDLLNKATLGHIKKEDFDKEIQKLNDSFKTLTDASIKTLKDTIDALGTKNEKAIEDAIAKTEAENKEIKIELKKLQDKAKDPSNSDKPKGFRAALQEAFMDMNTKSGGSVLKTVKDQYGERLSFKEFFDNGGQKALTPPITVKTLVDMLESDIVGANVSTIRLTELDPNRVGIPLNPYQHAISIFPVKNMAKPYMSLLVVYEYEDGAGTKTEGSAPNKSSFKLKTVEFKAFVIGTYFTLSDETLDDLEEVMDEIAIIAPDKILDQVDDKIFRTTGDDSSDIKGLFHADKSTAFDSVTYADEYQNASLADLAQAMKVQAEAAGYRPDTIVMHPRDKYKLATEKNTLLDNRVDRKVVYDSTGQATYVSGLRIVVNREVTVNTMAVFDSRLPWIGRRKDMTMTIGYNGTDLTEGQRTVVLNIRLAFGVRDKAGVIYSSNVLQNIADISHS